MNIKIIGSSAGLELETVKRGLNRNHLITTLSRSEIQIEEKKLLNRILGDAPNKADLLKSIQNAKAINVTLGIMTNC
jgi:hypothetical protein